MENRNQIVMLAVLGVALLGVLIWQVMKGTTPTAPPKPAGNTTTASGKAATPAGKSNPNPTTFKVAEVDIDSLLKNIEVVDFNYEISKIDRNPLSPLVGVVRVQDDAMLQVAPTTMVQVLRKRVTGIIWDDQDPAAVVDDEVVNVGHVYPGGLQVQAIEADRVIFKTGDSLIPVEMKELGGR